MPGSGSETRQRQVTLKARFNEQEAALVKSQADAAGVPVPVLFAMPFSVRRRCARPAPRPWIGSLPRA